MTPTPLGSRWITWPAIGRACCIWRSTKPTAGRTTRRYDRVLEAYGRTDRLLQELWVWLQSQPDYRDRTSLLITTDHGRGRTPADWHDHHEQIAGAGETWMAFVSPAWSRRGEWRNHAPLTASQAAATLIAWMGGDWKQFRRRRRPGPTLSHKITKSPDYGLIR